MHWLFEIQSVHGIIKTESLLFCSQGDSMRVFVLLLFVPTIHASGYYFRGHGFFNNSCPVNPCGICGTGQYRLGCVNASAGACTNCTRIPNATFTSHGWFNNSCNFTCSEGFIAGPGRVCTPVITLYTVDFKCSLTLLNSTLDPFNITKYINAVAAQVGCAACGKSTFNPVLCGLCKIAYTVNTSVPVVYRRLLSSGSQVDVSTSITIENSKKLADQAVQNINSNALASKLASPTIAAVTVTEPPKVSVQVIQVPPPPPPPPPTDPPPLQLLPVRAPAQGQLWVGWWGVLWF
jgi:hypothetical protein